MGRESGPYKESKEFYDIIITRHGGYDGVLKVLEATNQTGALECLRAGLHGNVGKQPIDSNVKISGEEKNPKKVSAVVLGLYTEKNQICYNKFLKIML